MSITTPTTTSNVTEPSDDSSDDDNALVVAAIVVGITVFIVAHVILVAVIIWYRWNKNNRQALRISGKYDVTEAKAVVVSSNGLPVDEHQSNDKLAEVEKQVDHIPVVDENQVKTFCVYKISLNILTHFSYMR